MLLRRRSRCRWSQDWRGEGILHQTATNNKPVKNVLYGGKNYSVNLTARLQMRPAFLGLLYLVLVFTSQLRAVIFYSTADSNHNTTAPTGTLAGSGWQWVGSWGGFQGTPIGPHHFLAARHVGGTVGDLFVFGGVNYTTVASFDDTVSDLRIWQVSETFPNWAPLYRASDEIGRSLVVFGRGLTRGAEVRDVATNSLRGWQWGAGDGRLRWGENAIKSTVNGGTYWGQLLHATFDAGGLANEVALAEGDSSGPIFIDDGQGWKLAGIAAAVDGSFNTTNAGPGFSAAIFDARGLYYGNSSSWTLVGGTAPSPSGFYATRISVRTAWIDGIVPVPSPLESTDVPLFGTIGSILFTVLLFGTGTYFSRGQPARKAAA